MSNEEKLEELKQLIIDIGTWNVHTFRPEDVKDLVLNKLEGVLND